MARYKTRLLAQGELTTVVVEGRKLGERIVRDVTQSVVDGDVPSVVRAAMDRVKKQVEGTE